jgi:hypothetical protein
LFFALDAGLKPPRYTQIGNAKVELARCFSAGTAKETRIVFALDAGLKPPRYTQFGSAKVESSPVL